MRKLLFLSLLLFFLSFIPTESTQFAISKTESISKIEAVQCKGTTKKGKRCKRKTNNANGYCWQHQDQAKQ